MALTPGLHTCYHAADQGTPTGNGTPIPKNAAQFRWWARARPHEAGIVFTIGDAPASSLRYGADQRRRGECVPEPCTHTPQKPRKARPYTKARPPQAASAAKAKLLIGTKS